ncbi:iron-siderophore ABC transporter substrate-binding protein [Blastococcus saxobsidens]|uniref:Putative iron-siderophore ABC transporter, substrate-binding protein n=1 Tax=Blastococcus saxobsidens (strain DD2) TaxID=1146883 RepID=H6RT96_BLASD|nr:iron-siderophore ABC transporter substrate-binding protein [Blastococcus saxobsidens]CCG05596.1 putative iron-siderophore ABC transporter, substrate-binding protein [Blastococcus saxobsidens DD2]
MRCHPALRSAATVAATALVLTGCGAGDEPTEGAAPEGTTSSSGAFPVTVETAFGDVTVEDEPARVVALGWGDAETALALGVQPVGASDWLGFGGDGVGPWAEGRYDTSPEIIETLEPSYEAIAALDPDLILDTKSAATPERHEALSAIAPTISQPEGVGPYQTGWEQQLEMIGQALGRSEEADELQGEVDQAFADAAAAHPEFEGTEVAVGAFTSEGYGAYVRGDARVDFMEQLGFENAPAIQEIATDNFFVPVSEEQLSLLDAELTVAFPIFVEASEFTASPLWQSLDSVQDGRAVVLEDPDLISAFSSGSPLGIQYAIENAVPQFADALG